MATYKEIKGVTVQTLDSDPVEFVGSWSSQPTLNTTRNQAAGFGTASNMGAAGGNTGSLVTNFELWDGTSWTETTEINTARRNARGVGTYTEGLIFGGWHPPAGSVNTEDWNGTAWTEVNDMTRPGARQSQGSFGIYTAAITAGGEPGTGSFQLVEKWDGTNWTEVNELNTGRSGAMGFGILTSGFIISGYSPPAPPGGVVTNVESFNGTSFTETTDINSGRGAGGATGTTTAGITYGGQTPAGSNVTKTESWDGSSWTEVNDLSTGRTDGSWTPSPSSGNRSALFVDGGVPGSPGFASSAEEWSFPPPTSVALTEGDIFLSGGGTTLKGFGKAAGIPAGTWASGTDIPTANRSMGIFGPSTSTIIGGGYEPGGSATNAYSWNGSSWSDIAELNANKNEGVGYGNSSTSGFINKGTNEEWDGSSWTERNDLNTTRVLAAAAGSSTAALIAGGEVNPSAVTESWDGTSWTEVGDLNEGRYGAGLSGTQTAAIFATGVEYPGGSKTANAETWNGSSWTEGNNVNEARVRLGYSSKSVSIAMIFAGENASNAHSANTEIYNGTSWTEINNMSTARRSVAAGISGSASSGSLAIGGNPPTVATVEEWSVDNALGTITLS